MLNRTPEYNIYSAADEHKRHYMPVGPYGEMKMVYEGIKISKATLRRQEYENRDVDWLKSFRAFFMKC